ncbi:MAG: alpha/beta fold hydrolase [Acidimicrobiia bacterium]|nr:alpha/beta fold hydrolase [Acidimicrobiia bacterium]
MRVHTVINGQRQEKSDPAMIFLHGVGSSSATWSKVMDLLQDRFLVAAFDLLGHGASPNPDEPELYSRDAALIDIDDLITEIGRPVVLVGHSLGGYLALAHAATRVGVIAGLVVLNTGPGFRDPEKREAWNERSRRNAHRFGVSPQAAEINLQHDGVVMERLSQMDVPTLVVAGTEDRPEYAGAGRYMERKMPNCRFVAIDGGEHAMHESSHAMEIADLVADLAAGIASGGGPG